jgi:arsenate reductase
MKATIFHNPACATSRNVLGLIRHVGIEPHVIEYLVTPPTRERLVSLIQRAGLDVRQALRQNVPPYAALGLDDLQLDDNHLLDAMLAHPILINRPFVETARGVCLARPSEAVLALLPPLLTDFIKEDGQVVPALPVPDPAGAGVKRSPR